MFNLFLIIAVIGLIFPMFSKGVLTIETKNSEKEISLFWVGIVISIALASLYYAA